MGADGDIDDICMMDSGEADGDIDYICVIDSLGLMVILIIYV